MTSNKSHVKTTLNLTEWSEKAVKDIAKIVGGGTPSTKISEYWNGNIPWITPKDLSIQQHKYICKGLRNITSDGLNKSSAKIIPSNSVILSTRAPVGYIAISKRDITTNQGCHSLIPNNDIDTEFLYYLILNNVEYLKSQSNGSTFGELSAKVLSELRFKLPTLDEQKAIAKILSDLDSKIELNEKMNKTLEGIAQVIFKHWFIDFEFPNEEGKPYKSSGGKMVDSELGKIPKGWLVRRIKDFCVSVENGGTPKRMEKKYWNGNIDWFKTGELKDRPLIKSEEKITEEGLKNSSCKLWKINTILIALYASPTVGRIGILKEEGASNQACSGLVAREEIGYLFLFYTLLFKRNEFNRIAIGAAQQNISQEIVKETLCIQPSINLLDNFTSISSRLMEKQTMLEKEQATLSSIRDNILPRLLSGKIKAPLEEKNDQ